MCVGTYAVYICVYVCMCIPIGMCVFTYVYVYIGLSSSSLDVYGLRGIWDGLSQSISVYSEAMNIMKNYYPRLFWGKKNKTHTWTCAPGSRRNKSVQFVINESIVQVLLQYGIISVSLTKVLYISLTAVLMQKTTLRLYHFAALKYRNGYYTLNNLGSYCLQRDKRICKNHNMFFIISDPNSKAGIYRSNVLQTSVFRLQGTEMHYNEVEAKYYKVF